MREINIKRESDTGGASVWIEIKQAGSKKPTLVGLTEPEAVNLMHLLVHAFGSDSFKSEGCDVQQYVGSIEERVCVIDGYESYEKTPKPATASASRIYLPLHLAGRKVRVIVIDPPLE